MARFGAIYACGESFVPLWPPRTRAGRVLYRTQGRVGASHDTTTGTTSAEGTGGTTGTRRMTGGLRQDHRQTNFACNSIGPNFNKPRKRCNSNDANSMFEHAAGELHAKLMIDSQNWATCSNPDTTGTAQGREPAGPRPPDATTQTRLLRSTCVRSRSARAGRPGPGRGRGRPAGRRRARRAGR